MFTADDQHRVLYERSFVVEDIRQYLLTVIAAALLCGVINGIIGKKSAYGAVVKLVTGLFLAVTVISPWVKFKITDFSSYIEGISADAQSVAASGELMAQDELASIIKTQTQTYILDKATSLKLDVEVEVTLCDSDPPLPCAVTLRGAASPYAKEMLCQYIANDLGIPEEDQLWM